MKLTPWDPDVRTLVDRIDDGDIDLQPNFQRQEIWATSKKKRLIDTILRGWSIPPAFFVVTSDGTMDVLDGQQRLASIRDFVHNDFSVDGEITPIDPQIQSLHGKFYKTLPPTQRRLIDQHSIRCFKITDYSPDEPSELFYRLNQPSPLTAGEQRNAFYGPAREQLKDLVEVFESGGNVKDTIGFSNTRLAYDDIVARLLFFLSEKTITIKSTETVISQRFRDRSRFADSVFEAASLAIAHFSQSRKKAGAVRLNKASTLSWLLFFSRFTKIAPQYDFMREFSADSASKRRPHFVGEAIEVFQDRASLRVTDVSSVVFRDFALWYSYFYLFEGSSIPRTVSTTTIKHIEDALADRDDVTFEFVLQSSLDIAKWGSIG